MAKTILITGAGPTGLTAAIEVARRGFTPRVIDRKPAPSPLSRAVGIHAQSLVLLEESGVTPRLLAEGIRIQHGDVRLGASHLATIRFEWLRHRYNFLLALPQDRTETILRQRLRELGIEVEYGTRLDGVQIKKNGVTARIISQDRTHDETFDIVIGADGVHSTVRDSAGITMPGHDYPNLWSIADFESSDMPWARDDLHLFIQDHGLTGFLVRIGEQRYRAVSNSEDALKAIPGRFTANAIHNANTFRLSVRQAPVYQLGQKLFLAGDAAHVHSPAGARGMNLGIEDAHALARRIAAGDSDSYTAERRPDGRAAIILSENAIHMAQLKNPVLRGLRNSMLAGVTRLPFVMRPLLERIAGLKA